MVFDNEYINWNDDNFPIHDWSDFYHDAQYNIPANASPPWGIPVQVNAIFDASLNEQ